jgi:hypothetical protein
LTLPFTPTITSAPLRSRRFWRPGNGEHDNFSTVEFDRFFEAGQRPATMRFLGRLGRAGAEQLSIKFCAELEKDDPQARNLADACRTSLHGRENNKNFVYAALSATYSIPFPISNGDKIFF